MYISVLALPLLGSVVAANSAGQLLSLNARAVSGLFERQTQLCTPVPAPATCEKSCGPGYVECVSFPTCYNPGKGDVCCSDGSYCLAGEYCTDGGCCPIGSSLAECGATVTLSVIPPPAGSATASAAETTSYPAEVISSTEISNTTTTCSSSHLPVSPTYAMNYSATASYPAVQTANNGQKLYYGTSHVVLGGITLLLMLL